MVKIFSKRMQDSSVSDKEYKITSGETPSFWIEDTKPLLFSKLKKNISVDVAVVGAGITGLTTAYLLSKSGKKVCILEDGAIGSGETGRTTAHITYALDDRIYHIDNLFGEDVAKKSVESHKKAIGMIEQIIRKEKIKCDFERVDGYLYLSMNDEKETLNMEEEEFHKLGLTDVKIVGNSPVDSFDTGKVLKFPNQAQFHPLKYLHGLAKAIIKSGGEIYTETHVIKTKPHEVHTKDGYTISAKKIVIATGSPVKGGNIFVKQAAYRSYVIASRIPKGLVKKVLLWDTGDKQSNRPYPYHYIRTHPLNKKEDLLIVGGEDHRTGNMDDAKHPFENLENWVKAHFPFVKRIDYKWSGQIIEPIDSLAFIGHNPKEEDIFMATGDSGNGITHGTIAGILLRDLILEKKNEWKDMYEPQRKTPLAIKVFLRENMNVITRYKDYFTTPKLNDPNTLEIEEGGIIRKGLRKLAVFKDHSGKVYSFSAVCPHKGGIVKWNRFEKTFDCPCHGSRFTSKGKVINGPATRDLKPIKLK